MPTTFRPYQPDQSFLLPLSPRDWLPEDHLAYFISETVDRLDVSAFYRVTKETVGATARLIPA